MSVVVGMAKDGMMITPPILRPRLRSFPQDAFDLTPVTVGLAILLTLLALGLIAWQYWLHGRDRAYLTQFYLTNDPREGAAPISGGPPIVAEFEPPLGMRAAEIGVLLDETADTKDVTATIVDLAVRGYLTITEVPQRGVLGSADWLLTLKKTDPTGLAPFEWTIIGGIFAGREQVNLSALKGTFAPDLQTAETQLYKDVMDRKLFSNRPDMARSAWLFAGLGLALLGGAAVYGLGTAFGWGLVGLPLLIAGLVLVALHRFMPQRTAAGHDALNHVLGFRLYMNTAERYRQQFAEKAQIFTQLLPYAIVFGCVGLWAKAFEGIDTSAASGGWYVGSTPFQAAMLSGTLESFSSNLSSAIAYVPPSAGSGSGFSGGFSGGGGGGGGGGSW
jgi:uncharacterized membrane protein YgcG